MKDTACRVSFGAKFWADFWSDLAAARPSRTQIKINLTIVINVKWKHR